MIVYVMLFKYSFVEAFESMKPLTPMHLRVKV